MLLNLIICDFTGINKVLISIFYGTEQSFMMNIIYGTMLYINVKKKKIKAIILRFIWQIIISLRSLIVIRLRRP